MVLLQTDADDDRIARFLELFFGVIVLRYGLIALAIAGAIALVVALLRRRARRIAPNEDRLRPAATWAAEKMAGERFAPLVRRMLEPGDDDDPNRGATPPARPPR